MHGTWGLLQTLLRGLVVGFPQLTNQTNHASDFVPSILAQAPVTIMKVHAACLQQLQASVPCPPHVDRCDGVARQNGRGHTTDDSGTSVSLSVPTFAWGCRLNKPEVTSCALCRVRHHGDDARACRVRHRIKLRHRGAAARGDQQLRVRQLLPGALAATSRHSMCCCVTHGSGLWLSDEPQVTERTTLMIERPDCASAGGSGLRSCRAMIWTASPGRWQSLRSRCVCGQQ